MKKIVKLIICCWFYTSSSAQTTNSITDINNNAIGISSLQGKKILLVVLPTQKDTGVINQLLRFQKKNAERVTVVGLVTIQSGTLSKDAYKQTYGEVSQQGIIISEGLTNAGTTTDERESVMQWLTSKSNDRRQDRYTTGSKYFLSEDGRLYAQLGAAISLDDRVVQNIVNAAVPRAVFRSLQKIPASPDAVKDSTQTHF